MNTLRNKGTVLAAICALALSAAPAHSQHQFTSDMYVKVIVTTCWTVPLTGGMKICHSHYEYVAIELLDEFLAGTL